MTTLNLELNTLLDVAKTTEASEILNTLLNLYISDETQRKKLKEFIENGIKGVVSSKVIYLYGNGCNGKTTFIKKLKELYPKLFEKFPLESRSFRTTDAFERCSEKEKIQHMHKKKIIYYIEDEDEQLLEDYNDMLYQNYLGNLIYISNYMMPPALSNLCELIHFDTNFYYKPSIYS